MCVVSFYIMWVKNFPQIEISTKISAWVKVEQKTEIGALIVFDFHELISQCYEVNRNHRNSKSDYFLLTISHYMTCGGKWVDDNCFVLLDRNKMQTLKVFLSGKFENLKFKIHLH